MAMIIVKKAYIFLRGTFNQQHDQLRPKSAHAYTQYIRTLSLCLVRLVGCCTYAGLDIGFESLPGR